MRASNRVSSIEPSPIRKLMDRVGSMSGVLGLHVGEPDFDTPTIIKEAAKKALDEGATHYTFAAGIPELRKAIAEKLLKENSVKADPESEITVTVGGYGAIFSAIQALVDVGDEVLIPEPAWPAYRGFVRLAGGIPIPIPLKPPEYMLDVGAIEDRITEKTRMIIINTPNNPVGSVYPRDALTGIARLAAEKQVYLLSDEVYERIVFDGVSHLSPASIQDVREYVVSVYSFSKTYAMTGWRIGYVVASRDVTRAIRVVHSYMASCVNPAVQIAALTALWEAEDYVRFMVDRYRERRDLAYDLLSEIPSVECVKPKGTFYLFPDFSRIEASSMKLSEKLLEE
ncbi:MAG: pyridoxal phosphate-dependent aminotransferase, partial [Candidatus Bathyarchaeia archaeon]